MADGDLNPSFVETVQRPPERPMSGQPPLGPLRPPTPATFPSSPLRRPCGAGASRVPSRKARFP